MAKLIAPFNPEEFNPEQSAGALPVGKHPVVIVGDEVKATKNNDGGFLQLTLRIIDGPSAGVEGPYRLNLYSNSEAATRIAHNQLSALCYVTGQFKLGPNGDDTSVLHNIPFIIDVALQPGEEAKEKGYTEVKKVYDINGNEPKKGASASQPAQTAQTNTAWGKPAEQATTQAAGWSQPTQQASQEQPQTQKPAWGQPTGAGTTTAPWAKK